MSQDIHDFHSPAVELLALGEPTHFEPAFPHVRNELFARLAEQGFRSIALESDRVAALAVDDFVRRGIGSLDSAMRDGFSHDFGGVVANRRLVAWMREYNDDRPPENRLSFHGFDLPTEMMSAPSPRPYLEEVRDHLGEDRDIAALTGDDEQWSRAEAVMDPSMSIGDTVEARELRAIADDMLTMLYVRAQELIDSTSHAAWVRANTELTGALALLRYHREAARPGERNARWSRLSGIRDGLMARNLLDIRTFESGRGPTLVFAHNLHLRRGSSGVDTPEATMRWDGAGAIIGSLIGERYTFIAGSIGRSPVTDLGDPPTGTYEATAQRQVDDWGLLSPGDLSAGTKRTDTAQRHDYFPLDDQTLAGADAILHIADGTVAESDRSTGTWSHTG